MKIVPGPDGWPEAYDYSVGGQTVRFRMDVAGGVKPILHMALFNPLNDHYGMSPLEAAAASIDIHNASGAWNKALLDNSACPSGALVYSAKDGQLSPEQFERLKAELEESFQGARNAGRPLLLEGGLDWKAMAFSPKDMDFIAAKHVAAREVALALGVPPMLLGIPGDNTYSNYAEANRSFWRQTILPLVSRTAKGPVGLARRCVRRSGAGAAARPRHGRGALHRARGAVGARAEVGLSYGEREARCRRLRRGRRRRRVERGRGAVGNLATVMVASSSLRTPHWGDESMALQLTPPTRNNFILSVILAGVAVLLYLLGVLGVFEGGFMAVAHYAFWVAFIGWVIMAIAVASKGF